MGMKRKKGSGMTQSKISKTNTGAVAIQATSGDGSKQFFGIGNLRVLLVPDGKYWFAQGLEIDYGAQGDTPKQAKENFQRGLFATIDLNIKINGNVDDLLVFAPSDVLREAVHKRGSLQLFFHVSAHDTTKEEWQLPFPGIDYLIEDAVAA